MSNKGFIEECNRLWKRLCDKFDNIHYFRNAVWLVIPFIALFFALRTLSQIDLGIRRDREEREDAPLDTGLIFYIFVIVAISLTLQEYYGNRRTFIALVRFIDNPINEVFSPFWYGLIGWLKPEGRRLYDLMSEGGYLQLWSLGYWALWRVLGFFAIPTLAIWAHPRLRFGQMGLGFKGVGKHIWVYVVLLFMVLVGVVLVSFSEDFTSYYPFYDNAHRTLAEFAIWELLYIAQFFSLEFFFRGFMILPFRRSLGSGAVLAMMIPYVMIHYGKPVPEVFAAIFAGVVLGALALRTRSIWLGVLIHVSVALAMDLLSIYQNHW